MIRGRSSIRTRATSGLLGASLATVALMGTACPEEEGEGTGEAAELPRITLPDRVQSRDETLLLRLNLGQSTTSTAVHRELSEMFMAPANGGDRRVSVRAAAMRGDVEPTAPPGDAAAQLAGSSADQALALLQRILVDRQGPFQPSEAVDECGNPMVAAFASPDVVADLMPDNGQVSPADVMSSGAQAVVDGAAPPSLEGIWDITLTEKRYDGMLDVILQLYPSVDREVDGRPAPIPGYLGPMFGFFLTDNSPGLWQVPLFLAVERVNVAVQGLLERDRAYTDAHFGDRREVYVYPHKSRTVALKDVSVSMQGDPLCDEHHADEYGGPTPYGCQLEDGRNLPVQLDVGSSLGGEVYANATASGKDTQLLDMMAEALSYQAAAWLACPTLSDDTYIRLADPDDSSTIPVAEVMVCPDRGVSDCLGFHDMETAGCYRDNATYFPPQEATLPSQGGLGSASLSPSTRPWSLSQDPAALGSGMEASISLSAGEELTLYGDDLSRITLRAPGGGVVSGTSRSNTHGCTTDVRTFDPPSSGTYTLEISGNTALDVLIATPDVFVP